jgi:molecular chaperone DnaJ
MSDPYQVLGVAPGASLEALKAAYRRLTKQRHPDMPGGSLEEWRELSAAYRQALEDLKLGRASATEVSTRDEK